MVHSIILALGPLRHAPVFRRFWIGTSLQMLGGQVTAFAVLYQAWEMTGSTLMTGMVGLVVAVPTILFGFLGGILADTRDRRGLILLANLGAVMATLLRVGPGRLCRARATRTEGYDPGYSSSRSASRRHCVDPCSLSDGNVWRAGHCRLSRGPLGRYRLLRRGCSDADARIRRTRGFAAKPASIRFGEPFGSPWGRASRRAVVTGLARCAAHRPSRNVAGNADCALPSTE